MKNILTLFLAVCLLAACSQPTFRTTATMIPTQPPSNTSTKAAPQPTPSRVTIWLDGVRMQGAKIYQKLYPEKAALIDFKEVGRSRFPDEVLEFNRKGGGWPDVVFIEPDILTQVVDSQHDFPLDLNPVLPPDLLEKFEPHAHDVCSFGDKLFCLRHDTSPMVLYYNQPLMKEFGYSVPATWEQYQAIGERVSTEHPGYYIGSFGDAAGFKTFFDASGCASSLVQGEKSVVINFEDERCKRASRLVDALLANGTLAPYGLFDPRFNQIAQQNKLLMLVGPAWLALYSFSGKPGAQYYQTAEHQLGVAAPLRWQGDTEIMTSAMGGAGWVVSKHTQNVPLALDFIIWMVSAPEFWAISPDYPVYLPIQPEWEKVVSTNPLFANDPFPAMQTGSLAISPLFTLPSYNVTGVLDDFVSRVLREKKTIESLLPELQATMIATAKAAGYTVQTQSQP